MRMIPEQSQAGSAQGTRVVTVGNVVADETAILDHGIQDLLETEVLAGVEKWSGWKSLALIAVASIAFWALIFTVFRVLIL